MGQTGDEDQNRAAGRLDGATDAQGALQALGRLVLAGLVRPVLPLDRRPLPALGPAVQAVPAGQVAGDRRHQGSPVSDITPGWYKDPADPDVQRYWDGEGWLGDPIPAGAPTPAGPPVGAKPEWEPRPKAASAEPPPSPPPPTTVVDA